MYEAHTYIINHFLEELTWDDVADHVGLSKNYLRIIGKKIERKQVGTRELSRGTLYMLGDVQHKN